MEKQRDEAESSSATSEKKLQDPEEKLKKTEEEIVALKIQCSPQDLSLQQEATRLEDLLKAKEQ